MKVALLLLAVMLALAVLAESYGRRRVSFRRRSYLRRRVSFRRRSYLRRRSSNLRRRSCRCRQRSLTFKKEETAEGEDFAEQLEMLQHAADMLKKAVDVVEEGASLDPGMGGPQEMEGLNGGLDGDAFVANLQGPAGELVKKMMTEAEEDAALGQVEEELEELEEELVGANGDPGGTD
ncbi:Hypp4888 [Branchiostoma lanceolatum]|uniref:Hypp4888 protein n=1 Tax=Branchiostoma lanceolatum TaxID=7740 RepID=A0A8K0F322_BRALA|nr:Hypp4888 [Branchiostoma lanceolatum]